HTPPHHPRHPPPGDTPTPPPPAPPPPGSPPPPPPRRKRQFHDPRPRKDHPVKHLVIRQPGMFRQRQPAANRRQTGQQVIRAAQILHGRPMLRSRRSEIHGQD